MDLGEWTDVAVALQGLKPIDRDPRPKMRVLPYVSTTSKLGKVVQL